MNSLEVNIMYHNYKKTIGYIYAIELNPVKVYLCGQNWSGRKSHFKLSFIFLDMKHTLDVHTYKSPKICTYVERAYLYKAGLLLSVDVTITFLSKKSCKNQGKLHC